MDYLNNMDSPSSNKQLIRKESIGNLRRVFDSFFSLILTLFILVDCLVLDVLLGRKAIVEFFKLINKNFFDINLIFFGFSLAFLCSFVIIFLLYFRKSSKYIMSSLLASGIAIMFFTLFFGSLGIVRNFYFASNEFSMLVKNSFRNISLTNFSVSVLLILITFLYFIRRNKNEKEF